MIEEKALKIKKDNIIKEREEKTIKIINNLSDERVLELLEDKWIVPIMNSIYSVVDDFINDFIREIKFLENKYSETYNDIVQKNIESKDKICEMIGQLIGNEFDIKGLNDFKGFLGGE